MVTETEHKTDDRLWNKFTGRLAIPLLTAAIGFGSSQFLTVQTLRDKVLYQEHQLAQVDRDISKEEEQRILQDGDARKRIEETRVLLDERLRNVTLLLEAVLKQNTEVIGLFKVQQQLTR